MDNIVIDKTRAQWVQEFPVLEKLLNLEEAFWINEEQISAKEAIPNCPLTWEDVLAASARLERFAPYIAGAFPETAQVGGRIESDIVAIPSMKSLLEKNERCNIPGRLLLKCDSHLPISGSIKARGGIYEVLTHAEKVAVENGMLNYEDDYSLLNSDKFRKFFSRYSIAVGSTGNLGLSIGIMGAKLGFKVMVHMSQEARQWKKDLLRSKGVTVVEYAEDYSKAVEEGRKKAQADKHCYFIDDEKSPQLFLGYAVAALRVKKQMEEDHILVDEKHPLFVYLPCGVGGGPGGVAFGLKMVYGDAVHCFFAEPTHSPCMLLGMATGYHDRVCVQDFGIDNLTVADGLAVGRASSFVGKLITPMLSGIYTIKDERLCYLLAKLKDTENIALEPSALAGMMGPYNITKTKEGRSYLKKKHLDGLMENAVHLIWATGGNMVPLDVMEEYYKYGAKQK